MVFNTLNKYLLTKTTATFHIPFTIVRDIGYCILSGALNNGGYFTLQPIFAQGDWHFTTVETLVSSTVVTNCAGNERAVRYLKISEYINKGKVLYDCVING
jgi:hypothetical protein